MCASSDHGPAIPQAADFSVSGLSEHHAATARLPHSRSATARSATDSGLNPKTGGSVGDVPVSAGQPAVPALTTHQQTAAWEWQDLARLLYAYDRLLRDWFALDLPPFVIRFGRLRLSRYGHFMPGCNEFAIAGEVAINVRYVGAVPFGELVGTLHHEQLHVWQHAHGRAGRGNYHNREYQRKAADSGLIVNSKGHTWYDPHGRFVAFLREHGIDLPSLTPPAEVGQPSGGQSKLKKWTCGCTNVWAAVAVVTAVCRRCGRDFARAGPRTPHRAG